MNYLNSIMYHKVAFQKNIFQKNELKIHTSYNNLVFSLIERICLSLLGIYLM